MLSIHDHNLRAKWGLSFVEYGILMDIYYLSHNKEFDGWCVKSRASIAKTIGVSERTVFRAIDLLILAGFIEKQESTNYLRSTDKWNRIISGENVGEERYDKMSGGMTKCQSGYDKMSEGVCQNVRGGMTKCHSNNKYNIYKYNNKYNNINNNINTNIKTVDESEESFMKKDTTKSYGQKEINQIIFALKKELGITDFADSNIERYIATHMLTLGSRIGGEEFSKRLKSITEDPFKRKNCNRIKYLYNEMKAYIEPIDDGDVVFIS